MAAYASNPQTPSLRPAWATELQASQDYVARLRLKEQNKTERSELAVSYSTWRTVATLQWVRAQATGTNGPVV